LLKKDIKKIKLWIDTAKLTPDFVLFAPDTASTNAGQINYSIMLTKDDPGKLLLVPTMKAVSTGLNTNPSPPRKGG
jgi:hypothetical protein